MKIHSARKSHTERHFSAYLYCIISVFFSLLALPFRKGEFSIQNKNLIHAFDAYHRKRWEYITFTIHPSLQLPLRYMWDLTIDLIRKEGTSRIVFSSIISNMSRKRHRNSSIFHLDVFGFFRSPFCVHSTLPVEWGVEREGCDFVMNSFFDVVAT